MAEIVYEPLEHVPAERLEQTAEYLIPLGMKVLEETVEGKPALSVTLEEVTAELVSDVNAMFQVLRSLNPKSAAGGEEIKSGEIGTALLAYEALSRRVLHDVSDEDEQPALENIRRSAVENYPFFCDGQQLAQHTGLAGWDVLSDDKKEAAN